MRISDWSSDVCSSDLIAAAVRFYSDGTALDASNSAIALFWCSVTAAIWLMLTSIWKIFIAREIDDKEEPEIVHEGMYASVSTMQVMLSHYCRKRNCGKDIRETFNRVVQIGRASCRERVCKDV